MGTSPPIAFDYGAVYTPWQFSPYINGGFPYIVLMPSWVWPSAAYREAIAAPSRTTYITGTITTPDGDSVSFGDAELMSGSLSVSAEMARSDTLAPGAVPSSEMRITLVDDLAEYLVYGAEIAFSVFVMVDGAPYEIPMGLYTIYEAEQSDGFCALECYDRMKRLDDIRFVDMGIAAGKAYTPYEIIRLCADAAELTADLDETACAAMPNGDMLYMLAALENSAIETARDLLMHITQILCAFARINRYGVMEIIPIAVPEPIQTITERQRTRSAFTFPEYRLFAVEAEVTMPETDKTAQIIDMSLYADGVTVTLLENPLWTVSEAETASDIRKRIRTIREQLETCRYHPCTVESFGDPTITLFEWITYTGRTAGEGITSPVTSYVWRYHGTQTLTACGSDAVAGVVKSQAEKAAAASRMQMQGSVANVMRDVYLKLMQQSHELMGTFTHTELAHYTHAELGGTK